MSSIIKVNTYQDANGNALFSSDGSGNVTTSASGLQNTPAFHVRKTSSQSISYNTESLILWDYKYYDTDNAFDTSTYAFTVPTGKGGKYFLSSWYRTGTGVDNEGFQIWVNLNGTNNLNLGYGSSASLGYNTVRLTSVIDLSAGDVIKIYAFQNNNASSYDIAYAGQCGFHGFRLIGA